MTSSSENEKPELIAVPFLDGNHLYLSGRLRMTEAEWDYAMIVLLAMKPGLLRPVVSLRKQPRDVADSRMRGLR